MNSHAAPASTMARLGGNGEIVDVEVEEEDDRLSEPSAEMPNPVRRKASKAKSLDHFAPQRRGPHPTAFHLGKRHAA